MEGNPPALPRFVQDLKGVSVAFREADGLQRDSLNHVVVAGRIADLEMAAPKLRVPPDAVEQFVDRDHGASAAIRLGRSCINSQTGRASSKTGPNGEGRQWSDFR